MKVQKLMMIQDGKRSSGYSSGESFRNSCRNSSKDSTTDFCEYKSEDSSKKSSYRNFQELYRSFSDFHHELHPGFRPEMGISFRNSSWDLLQELVRGFPQKSIPETLQLFPSQIYPWISFGLTSRNLLQKFLCKYFQRIYLGISSRNFSSELH